jgi:hypothetical protein
VRITKSASRVSDPEIWTRIGFPRTIFVTSEFRRIAPVGISEEKFKGKRNQLYLLQFFFQNFL